jgi:hypothetical protein
MAITKRRKQVDQNHHHDHPSPALLPGLPDHITHLCLSLLHPSSLYSVCRSWRLLIYSPSFPPFLSALSHPLIFNPLYKTWAFGPPLATPRRWCAAGAAGGAVYVASGMGSQFSIGTAKSVEKWELGKERSWEWEGKSGLRDGRFSREAIDAVGWRGKLCMVNVKGDAVKEGLVYDVEKDAWEEMPEGMIGGWRGPVAAMDEEVMYALHERNGALRKYDPERDAWDEIVESERLRGAQQMSAAGGKVCVVCGGGNGIVVVDVVASLGRLWVVDLPAGFEAVAVHILPRMSRPEFGFPATE